MLPGDTFRSFMEIIFNSRMYLKNIEGLDISIYVYIFRLYFPFRGETSLGLVIAYSIPVQVHGQAENRNLEG